MFSIHYNALSLLRHINGSTWNAVKLALRTLKAKTKINRVVMS